MSEVKEFQGKITEILIDRGLTLRLWRGGTRASARLFEIDTSPTPTILYVKEGNASKGFWGLTKNQIDRLKTSGVRWYTVLLRLSSTAGYVLSAKQVEAATRSDAFGLSIDGDYKVNQGSDLLKDKAFQDLEHLLARISEEA
ncbi:MAG: hypothetical protein IIC22_08725 [Chloroflexi bacterium]|nr:hypothetical protein [Chloroflexota bacterium]